MDIVTDRDTGLFPKPDEITLACDCPDWATMCKHAAAVLYGIGSRLDDSPELLFRLRGVDEAELIVKGSPLTLKLLSTMSLCSRKSGLSIDGLLASATSTTDNSTNSLRPFRLLPRGRGVRPSPVP